MANELLTTIIDLEKVLQRELEAEQERAASWLRRVKLEVAAASESAALEINREVEVVMRRAEAEARANAEQLETTARLWCGRIDKLSRETLEAVVRRHLVRLLPGGDHDHQDVKG